MQCFKRPVPWCWGKAHRKGFDTPRRGASTWSAVEALEVCTSPRGTRRLMFFLISALRFHHLNCSLLSNFFFFPCSALLLWFFSLILLSMFFVFFFPLYPWDYYQLLCFWTPIGLLIVVIVNSSSYAPFFLLLTLLCFEPFSYLCFVPYMPSKLSFGDFDMWNVISYSIWNLRVAYGENFAYIRILIIY